MTSSTTWLIRNTSRRISLELVKLLVASSDNLIMATWHNPDLGNSAAIPPEKCKAGFAIQSKLQHAGSFSRYLISKTALNTLRRAPANARRQMYKQAGAWPYIITIALGP
ncbi:predicted protein [Postia placenta Mad-698-R]|uniref:Uncharacterized protein n=1 Tax=Postia placenta MAD-698-R-SB12 TaxID=670580 RepID=A0A1X6MY51_9APHY|nr:hypothetical protein POSPLADRAFT_1047522 [Postia placenta MAD-698-R-SB12]EED81161.1 predicted protein [Postia placenta Mad-698-R]OSX61295.1 hypothetical protein POSPLADRAFT_1047522 [Postia placenta MAD-698-R-SB12]